MVKSIREDNFEDPGRMGLVFFRIVTMGDGSHTEKLEGKEKEEFFCGEK